MSGSMMKWTVLTAVALSVMLATVVMNAGAAERKIGTIGPPPRQNPQRQTSGESLPPLPLPATPLRRSEPKAEPSPPLFVSKLKWGTWQDYTPNMGDIDNLLRHVRYQIDSWYGWSEIGINEVVALHKAGTPCQIPMLYITGYQKFELTDEQREALKTYLLEGGTIVADATLGSAEFTDSFADEMRRMFPDRRFDVLDLDHPIYRGYYDYANVHYFTIEKGTHTRLESPPRFMGLNIAARTAVVLSPYDMTCGWDGFYAPPAEAKVPDASRTLAMMPADAIRMGINLVSYTAAQRRFAKAQAETREIDADQPQRRAELDIALLRHNGDWNPDPNSLYQLVRLAGQQTSIPIAFDFKPVEANIESLVDTPVMFMCGMHEPELSDDQVDALRRHLRAGGFLFINNTSGFARFDREARALVARIFPERKLEAVPADHDLLTRPSDATQLRDAGTLEPREAQLEAVFVDGRAVVVYSPNDTLALLKGVHDPYANAYDAASARKLSINILCYALGR